MLGCSQEVRLHTTIWKQRIQSFPNRIRFWLVQICTNVPLATLYQLFMSYSQTQLSVCPIVQRNVIRPEWPRRILPDTIEICMTLAPDFLRSIIGQGEPKPRVMMTDFFSPLRWTQIEKMVLLHLLAWLVAVCYCSESFSGSSEQECDGR